MGPLGWFGRLPAWVAGVLVGTMIGLPVLAWALWPLIVAPRVDPASQFSPPSPTYALRTPAAVRTPTPSPSPSPSRTPRATVLEMQSQAQAQAEWERQQADHQDRQEAAEATRSVSPDRCCETRPPAAPAPKPVGPAPTSPAPTTIGPADIVPTPTAQPSDPTYTATPVWLGAYCGREKIGLTAISSSPEGTAGTPVACTEVEGELMPKWLPLPPSGGENK